MKKSFIKLFILVIILGLLIVQSNILTQLFQPKTAFAVGDLTVDWGIGIDTVGPIFTVTNMAPGQSESRSVTVTNDATVNRSTGVAIANLTQTKSLATALDILVKVNGTDVYGGTTGSKTVAQFATESQGFNGIPLTELAPSETKTIQFIVTFKQDAGNEFKNASASFDIQIGVTIDVPAACQTITFTSQAPIFGTQRGDILNGTFGNDLIFGLEGGDVIDGKGGDDCIVGGLAGDVLKGGEGNDILIGNEGGDFMDGGSGNDLLIGNTDGDSMSGGYGNDTLLGNDGGDSLKGGGGKDVLVGNAGGDTLYGGDNDDVLLGNEGSDALVGENGNDVLDGHDGSDSLDGGVGNDQLTGGPGNDWVDGKAGIDACTGEVRRNCEL